MTDSEYQEFNTLDGWVFKQPEYSDWLMTIGTNIHYRPTKGTEPNRFHRFMQSLCFGVVWTYQPIGTS